MSDHAPAHPVDQRPGSEPLTGHDLVAADLTEWRLVGKRLRTRYTFASYSDGLELVARIGAAAETADHHPDLDLRHGWLGVALHSHDVHAITSRDVRLARRITQLAAELGASAHPETLRHLEVAIDTADHRRLRPFWKALLGLVDHPDRTLPADLTDPDDELPGLWFQQCEPAEPTQQATDPGRTDTPGGLPARRRTHLDLHVPHDQARARIALALSAGGRLVTDEYAPSWWVLADLDGNEACVCTWQDSGEAPAE